MKGSLKGIERAAIQVMAPSHRQRHLTPDPDRPSKNRTAEPVSVACRPDNDNNPAR